MTNKEMLTRCATLEASIQNSIRIDELELELFRRDAKRALRKLRKRHRENLQSLAEIDQLQAFYKQQIENQENS